MHRALSILTCALVVSTILPAQVKQQTTESTSPNPYEAKTRVFGFAKDERGRLIRRAVVTLINETSKQKLQTNTDEIGQYAFEGMTPGQYTIVIAKEGFTPFSSAGHTVAVAKPVSVTATLTFAPKPPVVFLTEVGGGGGSPGGPDRGAGTPCDLDADSAIDAKTRELRDHGFQLGSVVRSADALDGIGRFRQFANNIYIFWSPVTCARFIRGEIYNKWNSLGRELSVIGYPISDEIKMYDGIGHYNRFYRFLPVPGSLGTINPLGTLPPIAFIVSSGPPRAYVLQNAIAHKWWELVERGRLGGFFPGYPVSDEQGVPGPITWQDFEQATIVWKEQTGAHEIGGAIRDKWISLNGPSSAIGVPITDEKLRPDGKTHYSILENGIIICSAVTNTCLVRRAPQADPYFAAAAIDLRTKQDKDIGRPVTYPVASSSLGEFQLYLQGDNIIHNSAERHFDGSIYLTYTSRHSPYWYDPYVPNDNDDRVYDVENAVSFGHFGRSQFGLPEPLNSCQPYQTPVPNLNLDRDYSVAIPDPDFYHQLIYTWGTWDTTCRPLRNLKQKNVILESWPKHEVALPDGWFPAPKWLMFTPRDGAMTPPDRISGELPPYGIPRSTQPFSGNVGAYCNYTYTNVAPLVAPCATGGADIWIPPEWQDILPLNARSVSDTRIGTKTFRGDILSGTRVKQLAQEDPIAASAITEFLGRPVRRDYCEGSIGWMSSDVEGMVTNSFLSGDDYSGDHVGYRYAFFPGTGVPEFGPNFGDQQDNPNYWLGNILPRWFGSCGLLPHSKDSNCDDWIVYVQPDPEYYFLQLTSAERTEGNFNAEHGGSLENEIEQWALPMGFRPEPGERIYMTGRWVVDCGHPDWHGELHPIESYVSSHLERVGPANVPRAVGGIQAISKVVVTSHWTAYPNQAPGDWGLNYPLRLRVWAPPRPSATAVLRFQKIAPRQGNFGLTVTETPSPPDSPNHLELVIGTEILESRFPRTHDYNQIYESPEGVRLGRRMATRYELWWEEPGSPPPVFDVDPFIDVTR